MGKIMNNNELREKVQKIFIKNLFRNSIDRMLAVKGGIAVNFKQAERYTKDIDLQVDVLMSNNSLKSIVTRSLKESHLNDLLENIKITMPKETSTVLRWKINGKTKQ